MMDHEVIDPIKVEKYNKTKHSKRTFSSGVSNVDNFLLFTADKQGKEELIKLSVAVDSVGAVVGYYATNAHALHIKELPRGTIKNPPSHEHVPAAFIAMMGVCSDRQGQGLGTDLITEAILEIVSAADLIGIAIVRLDVLRCGNEKNEQRRLNLYTKLGFKSLSNDPYKLYQTVKDIRLALAKSAEKVK